MKPSGMSVDPPTERFGTAVGWSYAMNFARLLATLGTTFLLASLLGPRVFGTVALALIYISLLQLVMQQGLVPAVIQRPNLTGRHLDSAFWLTMGTSLFLTIVSLLLSGWWAGVNNAPEAKKVIWALSGLVLVKGLVAVQEALLRRQLRFRELAIRTSVASIGGAAVGITWALVEPSIWALVAQQLTTDVLGCLVLWKVSNWRPRFQFWWVEAKELMGFAGKASLGSIGVFVNNRADAVLIGLFFGATAVGLYRLAARLIESAIEFTVQPVQHVALPEFSRFQSNRAKLRRRYMDLVLGATTMAAPIMATIFASADALLNLVGSEWQPAVAALRLLCIVGLIRAITMLNGSALQAAGRPGLQATMTWISAGVSAGGFALAGLALIDQPIGTQVVGIAASRAFLYGLVLLPLAQVLYVNRVFGVRWHDLLKLLAPTVLASSAAAAAGALLSGALDRTDVLPFFRLVAVGTFTLAFAAALTWRVNPMARQLVENWIRKLRRRRVVATVD